MEHEKAMKQVFVGGCGRSGTTLLGSMLGSGPGCVALPESPFLLGTYRRFRLRENQVADNAAAMAAITGHYKFTTWKLPANALSRLTTSDYDSYGMLVQSLIGCYLEAQGQSDVNCWIEHTPANTTLASTLLEVFPTAQFVHIVRDGRAVAASVKNLDWGPNSVIGAAEWWASSVSRSLVSETSAQLAGRIHRVQYERLVAEPQQTLAELCPLLGIPFHAGMIEGHRFQVPEYTRGQHRLIGSAPATERISAWMKSLTPREIELFEFLAGDLLKYLGYALVHQNGWKPPTPWERADSLARDLLTGKVANKLRHWRRVRRHAA